MARNMAEVMEKFDFTESIVTEVTWERNIFDLVLTIDYWWHIDEDTTSERGYGTSILKMTLFDCFKAEFNNNPKLAELSKDEIHADSWFTIVTFRNCSEHEILKNPKYEKFQHIEICTTDLSIPWISAIFKEITIERV